MPRSPSEEDWWDDPMAASILVRTPGAAAVTRYHSVLLTRESSGNMGSAKESTTVKAEEWYKGRMIHLLVQLFSSSSSSSISSLVIYSLSLISLSLQHKLHHCRSSQHNAFLQRCYHRPVGLEQHGHCAARKQEEHFIHRGQPRWLRLDHDVFLH